MFIADALKQMCLLLGIQHNVTAPYHPEAHGIVERENQEIIKKMKCVLNDFAAASPSTWDMFLPIVMRQINAHIHSAHGTSPHHIIFGTELSNNMQMFMHDRPFTHGQLEGPFEGNLGDFGQSHEERVSTLLKLMCIHMQII